MMVILCLIDEEVDKPGAHLMDPDEWELNFHLDVAKKDNRTEDIYIHFKGSPYTYFIRPGVLHLITHLAKHDNSYYFTVRSKGLLSSVNAN